MRWMSLWKCGLVWMVLACSAGAEVPFGGPTPVEFKHYWYSDGAEISRYKLTQSRYGELHTGDAVLLFVTESLRSDVQVKADNPSDADLPVLKLNEQRKFYTGVYPYSIMTSVFSPIAEGKQARPAKISTSVQEWCGHVYVQMNLRDEAYNVKGFSYFESEVEEDLSVPANVTEDGLFNLVRLAPQTLPIGTFDLVVGTVFSRLRHTPLAPTPAIGTLQAIAGASLEGNPLVRYRVEMPDYRRTLSIVFERDFPHRIERWDDTCPGSGGGRGKMLTTSAVRSHTIKSPYWQHHSNRDRSLLKKLGLEPR